MPSAPLPSAMSTAKVTATACIGLATPTSAEAPAAASASIASDTRPIGAREADSRREAVANAPDGLDEPRPARIRFDLRPQAANVDGHGRGVAVEGVLPHGVHEVVARENLPGVTGQEQQEVELPLGELRLVTVDEHPPRRRVDVQAVEL